MSAPRSEWLAHHNVLCEPSPDAPKARSSTVLEADDHWPPLDSVGGEDADLGLADDRRRDEGPERARVCDREGAPGDVVGTELALARPAGELGRFSRKHWKPFAVSVVDDRDDETLGVEIDSDPEM